ncbi:MAG: hypothetical protein ACI350_01685 [Prevotella sp.]
MIKTWLTLFSCKDLEKMRGEIDSLHKELEELRSEIQSLKQNEAKGEIPTSDETENIHQPIETKNHQENIITENSIPSDTTDFSRGVFYLPEPEPDGTFCHPSTHVQIGKSIYLMESNDGKTATFCVLNTPDAVATASISTSQFLKPVCRILPSANHQTSTPREIITHQPGIASKVGETWKVTQKAVISIIS